MTWEEYTNTDFYREAHHDDYRETREEKEENLMREYLADIDAYRETCSEFAADNADEEDPLYKAEHSDVKSTYICCKMWNGRITGILKTGNYEVCRKAKYDHDLACIDSQYDYGMVKRIEYHDDDELEQILDGYREECCCGGFWDCYDDDEY